MMDVLTPFQHLAFGYQSVLNVSWMNLHLALLIPDTCFYVPVLICLWCHHLMDIPNMHAWKFFFCITKTKSFFTYTSIVGDGSISFGFLICLTVLYSPLYFSLNLAKRQC